jgi:CRISPR-associated protein Cmr2
MDGDHMGAFFSQASEDQATDLSQRMSGFAREEAKQVVENHCGRLVYAGGDDALALLPLEEALPCALELQQQFKEAVKNIARPPGVKSPPTTSTGIVFAHHTSPLDGILLAMQRAGKSAKNDYGRDALSIHVLKRSGEEVRVGTHWQYGGLDAVGLVNELVAAFQDSTLSMTFAHDLAGEARGLSTTSLPLAARSAEVKRLARRHSPEDKDKKQKATVLAGELANWAESKQEGDKGPLGMEKVSQWVLLARFIASGGRDE